MSAAGGAGPTVGGGGRVVLRPGATWNGVKVFSATRYFSALGEAVTAWIATNRHVAITEIVVTQSSDADFHCLTITVFYEERVHA